MNPVTFVITLADLKILSDAVCELDSLKTRGDARSTQITEAAHDALIRTLGDQRALIYAPEDVLLETANGVFSGTPSGVSAGKQG